MRDPNQSAVTLVVADDTPSALCDVLDGSTATATTAALTDAIAAHDPAVVVVDAPAVADPQAVVTAIRDAVPPAAVVVGAGTPAGDIECPPPREAAPESIREAVAQARTTAAYHQSVTALYEQCRTHTFGAPDDAIEDARSDADARLASLPTDAWTVAAALRSSPPADDGDAPD